MSQIHRRFTDEQVKVLFEGYCQGQLARTDLQDLLGIGKSCFFALLKAYRQDPEGFTIAYRRPTPAKLSSEVEDAIKQCCYERKPLLRILTCPFRVTTARPAETVCGPRASRCR
jgi:hypothetical protein